MTGTIVTMTPTHRRLVRLAMTLDEFSRGEGPVVGVAQRLDMVSVVNDEAACGTTCCAIGLAALHPAFPELSWSFDHDNLVIGGLYLGGAKVWWNCPEVVSYFSSGDRTRHEWLFSPSEYVPDFLYGEVEDRDKWVSQNVTARDVINRIMVVLADDGINLDAAIDAEGTAP
jgi:hypothetical protein